MKAADALVSMQIWRDAGWLRALDLAFARLLHRLDPTLPGSLLLAAGWLAHFEGHGHSCLPLDALAADHADHAELLGWPAEAAPMLAAAVAGLPVDADAARAAWSGHAVLQIDPVDSGGSSPLVLGGGRLWLRRYWRYEVGVAAQVLARTAAIGPADAFGISSGTTGTAAKVGDPDAIRVLVAPIERADRPDIRRLIDHLFAPPAVTQGAGDRSAAPETDPDWQRIACALALRARLTLITGGPGTGKTWTAARLLVLLQRLSVDRTPLRVALAAPTGKAAARLRQSIDTALHELQIRRADPLPLADWADRLAPATTLHALLGVRPGSRRFVHDAANPLDVDLLIVDEASMIHLEMMAALLDALPPKARLVLLGDADQLASVEAGAVMADLCEPGGREDADRLGGGPTYTADTLRWITELTGQVLPESTGEAVPGLAQQTVVLRRSRRFSGPIGRLAVAVNRGDGAAALTLLRSPPDGALCGIESRAPGAVTAMAVRGRTGAPGGFRGYLDLIRARPDAAADFDEWVAEVLRAFDRFRVLCAVREGAWGVAGLNAAIEDALADAGLLQRDAEWYEGRPVMATRNDRAIGIFNGDIGVVLRSPGDGDRRRAWFGDATGLRSVAVGRLVEVETAFAMTVHKSQGSEFGHVVLVLPKGAAAVLTRELVYTGITRARDALTVVANDLENLAAASGRRTRRLSGLRAMLDRGAS